ncbi:methionine synthase [Nocardioides sp. GCM10027113]|uniref:methionine synthase n=1 Tax=unclassified Nocardioides TaxID=2615069 RepID=UPI0036114CDA
MSGDEGTGAPARAVATGVGSMPGDDDTAYAEALRVVLGELAAPDGLPHLPELPTRSAGSTMTGRALAVVEGLAADLQPAGWRLTDREGVDQRRARSQLSRDLDQLEEQAQGLTGAFKVQVAGPWTLAATVERPRGDRVLADHGARRDLAQSLAAGLEGHLADVRRRLPGVDRLVVQVDEPTLAAVLAGSVPTASGFHRHRSVDQPEASAALTWVLDAVTAAGAEPWVHTCAAGTPLGLLRGAGARGLSVDLALASPADHDVLATALEAGETVALGVLPGVDPDHRPSDRETTEQVLRWLDMLGLDPAACGGRLVVTASCGYAGASPAWVRAALTTLRSTARNLS